jgi:two-component system chemotaxis sensor kinase CheA
MVGMNDNSDFIGEFLVESSENLDQLDRDLLALESQPNDQQRLASIFRMVHTIKGNSGFFGFSKLGSLAHSGEHLLGRLRDGKLTLDERVAGTLYSMVDAVRSILRSIESTGGEGEQDYRELTQTLTAVAAEASAASAPAVVPVARVPAETVPAELVAAPVVSETASVATPAPEVAVLAMTPAPPAAVRPVTPPAPGVPPVTETTVRVDVGVLASILDLVGELVLARNQLRSIDSDDSAVQAVSQRIHTVTNALQEAAVKTRMQPVEQVFSKFPRTVRDLAVGCGKEVQFVVDGGETELDRTLVEAIRDPLTHLIRNAVDHGIETPEARIARGKGRAGRLTLRAFNESGRVTIEVADDGAGIAVQAVRDKAVARGLVSRSEADALPEDRILQFIFEPGFSTAAQVTSVSGRGVGMDVVKTNIEAIGGTVEIQSRPGLGTTVRVHVPLTLAILPALVVRCGGERFAIPQSAVSELVTLRPDRSGPRIEGLADAPVMRVRGRLVPVVFLDQFLRLREAPARRDEGTVVLVKVDGREFGLVVDGMQSGTTLRRRDLLDAASLCTIVVKPIGGLLAGLGLYSGATVLGDGGVVLILDLRGLLRTADLPALDREAESDGPAAEGSPPDRYLVCKTLAGRRVALPLAEVVRLEQYRVTEVQTVGAGRVVRRGDTFTPLHDADELLGASAVVGTAPVKVVVVDGAQGDVGVAVQSIVDVLEAESPLQAGLSVRGVVGTRALGGIATEVLDLACIASGASPAPAC